MILKNGVVESDYNALVALYNSTDGDNWIINTNWLTSADVSEWFGVRVEGNRVISLYLNMTTDDVLGNGLTGEIPPEIGNLTNLLELYLGGSKQLRILLPFIDIYVKLEK